jgi:hypothetical protein
MLQLPSLNTAALQSPGALSKHCSSQSNWVSAGNTVKLDVDFGFGSGVAFGALYNGPIVAANARG